MTLSAETTMLNEITALKISGYFQLSPQFPVKWTFIKAFLIKWSVDEDSFNFDKIHLAPLRIGDTRQFQRTLIFFVLGWSNAAKRSNNETIFLSSVTCILTSKWKCSYYILYRWYFVDRYVEINSFFERNLTDEAFRCLAIKAAAAATRTLENEQRQYRFFADTIPPSCRSLIHTRAFLSLEIFARPLKGKLTLLLRFVATTFMVFIKLTRDSAWEFPMKGNIKP